MNTCSGFKRLPRRSISPSRILREAIGRPSWARTIGTVRMPSARRPFAALASLRATATGWRSAETTNTSRSGKSSAGPYGSSIGSIRAWREFLAARNRFRLRSATAYGFARVRDSFAIRYVVRPMTTASGRPSKAARSRASWPACRRSNVPPRTTRIWRTIRSTRYKNDSGRQTAVADREEVGVHRVGGLSQRRLALDDLQLPQHVRPHDERVRRAVQDPLERQDPDAAERLLKQVEHRGAVHHGPLVSEAESLRSGQFLEASVVVDERAFVRGDHMLAAREGRDDVVHADLPRDNPQGRDLDHDVGPCAADVLGRRSTNARAAGIQGGARVRQPQRAA